MEFLERAEFYAAARGDTESFNKWYSRYREWYNVNDSVWCALTWLYDEEVAKLLKYQ